MKRTRMRRTRLSRVSAGQRAFISAYKLVRQQVLERDDWRCQYCGCHVSELHRVGMDLEVNHVVKRSQNKLLRLDPDNLISLCDPGGCHDMTEQSYAKGRLCITRLGGGRFELERVYKADKWATA